MQMVPPPLDPRQATEYAKLRIKDRERKRDRNLYPEDTSNPSQRKQLPRSWYVLLQFAVIVLLVVAIVALYHLLH